ncbi:MAG TPA: DUF2442 domain-containing protein [Candidatus Ozemobacteraceae bacterium]|nr:DUF2442 domain-containing protein [Candidatus Ozemobacteraceae bacterium]
MLPDITVVEVLGEYRLRLTFDDGNIGVVDLASRLCFSGIFAPLQDPDFFNKVRVDPELGTICWPNGADLDPVVLYSWAFNTPIPDYSGKPAQPKGKVA